MKCSSSKTTLTPTTAESRRRRDATTNYAENGSLSLPSLSLVPAKPTKDDIPVTLRLGDVWDCKTNALVGSLYDDNIEIAANNLDVYPIQTLDYSLRYIKDSESKKMTASAGLSMDAVILGLSVTIGKAQYTSTHQANLDKEQLQIHYVKENHVVRLLPNAIESLKGGFYEELLKDPKMGTHVVTEVIYGSHLVADLVITETSSKKFTSETSSGLGSLVIGPISAAVEAGLGAVFDSPPDSIEVEISIDSSPPVTEEPINVQDMFTKIKAFSNQELKRPFDYQEPIDHPTILKVKGEPLRLFLVPIEQFIPQVGKPDPSVVVVAEHLLESLSSMLFILIDFKEDGYYRKRITRLDYRLRQMMADSKCPITEQVQKEEEIYKCLATDLYSTAEALVKSFKDGGYKDLDRENLMKDYNDAFDFSVINCNIKKFADEGKRQLALVHADDVDFEVKAEFLTSTTSFMKMMRENTAQLKLILYTTENPDPITDDGAFLAIYNISKELEEGSVQVRMPYLSLDADGSQRDPFELEVIVNNNESKRFRGRAILFVLDFLSSVVGLEGGSSGKLHQTIAAFAPETSMALPIVDSQNLEPLFPLITYLEDKKWLLEHHDNESENWNGVRIFQTYMSLRAHIVDAAPDTSKWIICLPVAAFSMAEAVAAMETLRQKHSENNDLDWIVGDFNFGYDDAPLLLIFQNGDLKSYCLDTIDFLHLQEGMLQVPMNMDVLRENSTFRPERAAFAREVSKLFNFSLTEPVRVPPVMNNLQLESDAAAADGFDLATEFTKIYLDIEDRDLKMLNSFTRLATATEKFPDLGLNLQDCGWSVKTKQFSAPLSDQVVPVLHEVLFNLSDNLRMIGAFIYTIEFCLEQVKLTEPILLVGRLPILKPIFDMKESVVTMLKAVEIDPTFVENISDKELISATVETLKDVLKTLKQDTVLAPVFAVTSPRDNSQYIKTVQELISIVPQNESEPVKNSSRLLIGDNTYLDRTTHYLNKVNWGIFEDDFSEYLKARLLSNILQLLRTLRQVEWLQTFYKGIAKMDSTTNFLPQLAELISIIVKDVTGNNELYFIWGNPAFTNLVRKGLDDIPFVAALITLLVTENNQIPLYIPVDIKRKLLDYIETIVIDTIPDEWNTLKEAVNALKAVFVTKSLSSSFMRIFRKNLQRNPEWKSEMQSSGMLFYWNDSEGLFEEVWTTVTLETSIETYQQNKLHQQDEATTLVEFKFESGDEHAVENLKKFVQNRMAANALVMITKHQLRRRNTAEYFNTLWTSDNLYNESINLFGRVLFSNDSSKTGTLKELESELFKLGLSDAQNFLSRLSELQNQLENPPENEEDANKIEKLILAVRKQIQSRFLQVKHFVRELLAIFTIHTRLGSDSEFVKLLLPRLVSQFENGMSMEISDRFREGLNTDLVNALSSLPTKVFVVTFIGDSSKSILRDQLYPGGCPIDHFLNDQGTVTLQILEPEAQEALQVDAVLIVELDHLTSKKASDKKQRKLTSLALGTSDLTFVVCGSIDDQEELLNFIDIALIGSVKQTSITLPDIILTSQSYATEINPHFLDLADTITRFEFEFGAQKHNSVSNIIKRAEEDTLCQVLRHEPGLSEPRFNSDDIKSLNELMLSKFASQNGRNLKDWGSDMNSGWGIIKNSSIFEFSNSVQIIERFGEFLPNYRILQEKLENAMLKHAAECQDYLLEQMTKPRPNTEKSHLKANTGDGTETTDLLDTMLKHLTKLTNVPIACSPIGTDETKNICPKCQDVLTFLKKHTEMTSSDYAAKLLEIQWSQIYQNFLVLDIQKSSGITFEFHEVLNEFREDDGPIDLQEFMAELRRHYSDKMAIVPMRRLMNQEILEEYERVPLLVKLFLDDPAEAHLKMDHLSRGLELQLKLQDLAGVLLMEYEDKFATNYQLGMVRSMSVQVQVVLGDYTRKYEEIIDWSTQWAAHLYAQRVLYNKLGKLVLSPMPMDEILNYEAEIIAEILKESASGPEVTLVEHLSWKINTCPLRYLSGKKMETGLLPLRRIMNSDGKVKISRR